jgi:integrase/recombinase XerD
VTVSQCVEVYIQKRRDCGYNYASIAKVLRRFARFVGKLDISKVTSTHVEEFLSNPAISNNTWRAYAWHLRNFFKHWHGHQQLEAVPQVSMKPAMAQTFVPYVYTRQDVRALLSATTACQRAPKCALSALTLRTLILFLYGTGIRIGDALALCEDDVDLRRSTVRVRGTTVLERILPIGRDVRDLLRTYLTSDERVRFGSGRVVFLNHNGTAVRYGVVCQTFKRLRKISGIKRSDSSYQPRLHDLRHSFAVHSIAKWNGAGLDLDHVLPILATYMGNLDMHGLERYLELSPCNYQRTLNRLVSYRGRFAERKTA